MNNRSLGAVYESNLDQACSHLTGALAGIFTMGIAMNDDKVYLVVTQKEASA